MLYNKVVQSAVGKNWPAIFLLTCIARGTFTLILVHQVEAGGVILAWRRRTLINVYLAVVPLEARHTEAHVLVQFIHTDGFILARVRCAFV